MTSSWFFLSTLNYDARSTTRQIQMLLSVMRWLCSVWNGLVEEWSSLGFSSNAAADCGVQGEADQPSSRSATHCPLLEVYRAPHWQSDPFTLKMRNATLAETSVNIRYSTRPNPEHNEREL